MVHPLTDPSELCAEILAEGKRRALGVMEEARKEGEALFASAVAGAEKARREALENAQAEADRRRDRALASVPVEVARMRDARVESLLESLRERALRALLAHQGFDQREALAAMASEALAQMAGEAFVLELAPGALADLGGSLTDDIVRRAARPGVSLTLSEDPSLAEGGLVLRDLEGRQRWDDRFTVRLDRLWPELRVEVARCVGLFKAGGPGP